MIELTRTNYRGDNLGHFLVNPDYIMFAELSGGWLEIKLANNTDKIVVWGGQEMYEELKEMSDGRAGQSTGRAPSTGEAPCFCRAPTRPCI